MIVSADLPGMDMNQVYVSVENGKLTIEGERTSEKNSNGTHRTERPYGRFQRRVGIPESVDPDRVSADYQRGVLTIHLQKREGAQRKRVNVEVKS